MKRNKKIQKFAVAQANEVYNFFEKNLDRSNNLPVSYFTEKSIFDIIPNYYFPQIIQNLQDCYHVNPNSFSFPKNIQ